MILFFKIDLNSKIDFDSFSFILIRGAISKTSISEKITSHVVTSGTPPLSSLQVTLGTTEKLVIPTIPGRRGSPSITGSAAAVISESFGEVITVRPVITEAPAIPAVTGKPTIAAVIGFPARPIVSTVTVATARPIVPVVVETLGTTEQLVIPTIPGRPGRLAITGSAAAVIPEAFGERLAGFVTFDYGNLEESSSIVDITLEKDTFFGMILDGAESLITVQEQGSLTGKRQFTIPSGAILAIYTTQDGGKITNLRNGQFSTKSSTIILAPGTTFMIMLVDSTGLFYIEKALLVTTTTVEVTIPVLSMMGTIEFNSRYILTSIGTMTFSTQYILTETFSSEIIRSISFGLFYSESAESTDLIIRTTVNLPGFDKHLSAIVPLRSTDVTIKEEKLALVDGDLFAIIPSGGRGTVEVIFTDWSQKKYSITPGLIFAVKVAGSSVIEHLSRGYFTTERTVLSFPARSVIYVMKVISHIALFFLMVYFHLLHFLLKVAADGALVPDVEIVTESSFIVNVAIQSLVGIVRVSNTGSMTTFGEARFQIMPIAFSNSSSPVAYIGVFNLIAR